MRREGKPHIEHKRGLWWCVDKQWEGYEIPTDYRPALWHGRGFSATAAYEDWIGRLARFMDAADPYGRR